MQETLATIQNDSTMMLIAGIAIVVMLVIVLVVVVTSMRVKSYKDRFQNLLIEKKEKSQYITKIEKELDVIRVKNTKQKTELSSFDETKTTLNKANEAYKTLEIKFDHTKKELEKITDKYEALKLKQEGLTQAHDEMEAKLAYALEESNKQRTSNARLLMKLEKEVAKALDNQGKT